MNPRRFYLLSTVSIFLLWLPHFLFAWPGYYAYDVLPQMTTYLDHWYNTHHPVIHTFFLGTFYDLGIRLNNAPSTGWALLTLLQMGVLSASFSHLLTFLYRKKIPRPFLVTAILWYALFPAHQILALSATKDIPCAAAFLVSMTDFADYFTSRKRDRTLFFRSIVFGILSCLFRNNMLPALLAGGLIAVFLAYAKDRKQILVWTASTTAGALILSLLLTSLPGVYAPDTFTESLSVPLQGIARSVSMHQDEVEDEVLEEVFVYLPSEAIAYYNPYISDPVKSRFNESSFRQDPLRFAMLFLKMFRQYPRDFIDSFLMNTTGFWNPFVASGDALFPMYPYGLIHDLKDGHTIVYRNHTPFFSRLINAVCQPSLETKPLIGFFHRCGIYFWMCVLFFIIRIKKKTTASGFLSTVLLAYFATCFFGPVVFFRYIYCVVVCVPLILYELFAREA